MKETTGMKLAQEAQTELKEFTFHVSAIAKTRVSVDVTVPAEDLETARSIVADMHTSDFDWSDDYEPYDVMEETIEIEPWEEN